MNPAPLHDERQPVLDYASPVSRSSLRLAAKSDIRIDSRDDRLIVRETLAGRGQAIGALAFALFVMAIMGLVQLEMLPKLHKHLFEIVFFGGIQLIEFVVGVLVIQQTWRRTTFTVTADDIALAFAAPLSRTRKFNWPIGLFAGALVIDTLLPQVGRVVPELEIRLSAGGPLRLFTGHPKAQLDWLAGRVNAIVSSARQQS